MKPGDFVTSDTHFGHKAVIRYMERPFSSVEEMDEELIRRWNAKVPPKGATVYHLGDFSFLPSKKTIELIGRLNGTIRLVRGNHDKVVRGEVLRQFDWVKPYYESKTPEGRKIVMCHYPMVTWNKAHRGAWMLHGHCHGSLTERFKTTRMDVGSDPNNLTPLAYEEVVACLSKRTYRPVDHHQPDR